MAEPKVRTEKAKLRGKTEEAALRAERLADQRSVHAERVALRAADRVARHEEIRFLKRQQWAVTIAVTTLLGVILSGTRAEKALDSVYTRHAALMFTLLIAAGGIKLLAMLQDSLKTTRLAIDPNDPDPWRRGAEIMWALMAVTFFSALVVCYFLWLVPVPMSWQSGSVLPY
jgi:hypothetical protein